MKLCGRQLPQPKDKTMTDETTNTEQNRVAADCPNERLVSERLSEQALMLCYAIERAGADSLLTECSTIAGELRNKLIEWEDARPLTEHEKQLIDDAWEKHKANTPRFNKTYCSQCGQEFGPGDHGYSHCESHKGKRCLSR